MKKNEYRGQLIVSDIKFDMKYFSDHLEEVLHEAGLEGERVRVGFQVTERNAAWKSGRGMMQLIK